MAGAADERVVVACGCGAKLRVPVSAAGKHVKCPKCGGHVTIPSPSVAAAPPPPADDEGGFSMEDLARQEQTAATTAASAAPAAGSCPSCAAVIAPGSRVCTACGFDTRIGRATAGAGVGPVGGGAGMAGRLAKSAGRFVLGCVLSGVGAAAGGVVWYLVAKQLEREVAYVALAIGVLAGIGMCLGYRSAGRKAGVVAAGMAGMGIIGAKAVIFVSLLYAVVSGDTDDWQMRRAFVILRVAGEILDERGATTDSERKAQWDSAYTEATGRVNRMTDDEVEAKWREYREAFEAKMAEPDPTDAPDEPGETEPVASETGEAADEESSGSFGDVVKLFVVTCFGAFDALWFLLALGSAYKIGGYGMET